jgi:uncharacterized membrane protein
MMARLKSFGAFWYDFVIGDDWRVAAGVIVAFLATWGVSTATGAAWWVTPAVIVVLLPVTLWRAVATKG